MRRFVPIGALVIVIAALVVVLVASGGTAARESEGADPSPADETVSVVRRSLRQDVPVNGTFQAVEAAPVVHRSDGGPAVTLTSTRAPGSIVQRGSVLYRANQRPTILLYGSVPAWRTMKLGIRGRDVVQLQTNLIDLGYGSEAPFKQGLFDKPTRDAVIRWHAATGQFGRGTVPLGSVAFATGPRRVAAGGAAVGTLLDNGVSVLPLTGVRKRILVPLSGPNEPLAIEGRAVNVTLPDQQVVRGTISSVGAPLAAGPTTPSGEGATDPAAAGDAPASDQEGGTKATQPYLAVIDLEENTESIADGGAVSVLLRRLLKRDALTVPVPALVARPGGGYSIRIRRPGKAGLDTVPVRVGVFLNGVVEIRGRGISEGQRVAIPATL